MRYPSFSLAILLTRQSSCRDGVSILWGITTRALRQQEKANKAPEAPISTEAIQATVWAHPLRNPLSYKMKRSRRYNKNPTRTRMMSFSGSVMLAAKTGARACAPCSVVSIRAPLCFRFPIPDCFRSWDIMLTNSNTCQHMQQRHWNRTL